MKSCFMEPSIQHNNFYPWSFQKNRIFFKGPFVIFPQVYEPKPEIFLLLQSLCKQTIFSFSLNTSYANPKR